MANIMSLKSLRNKTSRNGFDLSFKKNFTAKAGELLPVMVKEVLPGDSFKIDLKTFTRTQPVNTAAFARIREYYDFFFVPYDLLWNKANTVLTQMYDNPQHAVSLDPTQNFVLNGEMPYISCSSIAAYLNAVSGKKNYFGYDRSELSTKLLEYLGYGNFVSYASSDGSSYATWNDSPLMKNLNLNLYGLLGYQKIYADYFRDSQWERISPSTFNVDFLDGTYMSVDPVDFTSQFVDNYNFFDLRYCNWQKDLFHGVVPRQQYGDVSVVPMSLPHEIKGSMRQTPVTTPSAGVAFSSGSVNFTVGGQTDQSNTGLSILALRQAEFLQKWKEITQSGNKDYKDQIEKHWNVSVGDGFSELCTYLGGVASSMDINEVVNNNITGDNAADIAGKGTGSSQGSISFNSNGKYGLLMCIYHCLPMLDYTTDSVDFAFTKVNAADYAIPEFDKVGMQGVPLVNLMNGPRSLGDASELILGYAPRYIDYKTSFDTSVGGFKQSLRNWVVSYNNNSFVNQLGSKDENNEPIPSVAPMNYTAFKVNPNSLNPLFAVEVGSTVNTDQFLCSSYFDIKAVRNLDVDGLPY